MKRIGILGGMSPESTVDYYNDIIHRYTARYQNHSYPEILIFSVTFGELIPLMEAGDWDSIGTKLAAGAKVLESAGADFIIIATNTMHKVVAAIRSEIRIPVLSLLDVLGMKLKDSGLHSVALLGTAYTMEDGFYQRAMAEYGVEVSVPDQSDRTEVNRIIFTELIEGKVTNESKQRYIEIINQLLAQGAEGVILGCTEIPLLVQASDVSVPLFNTTELHSAAALDYAIK